MASRIHGVPCTVFVPVGNNPEKNAAMRAYGATLEEGGKDFDEARERCERRAAETGARYVHSANEPLLIAGVGTYALEIFEEVPNADVVFVPIGGGSGCVRPDHRQKRARLASEDHRRRRRQGRRHLPVLERPPTGGGRIGRYLCRGDCHAGHVRPDVRDLQGTPRRFHVADRRRACRRRPARLERHPQPRRRRGRGGHCRGLQAPRRAGRVARGLRDERRQHRSGEAENGPRIHLR